MKVIDAHLHFSNREGFKNTAKEIGQVDYSATGLKKSFQSANIVAGVIMGTPSRETNQVYGYPDEFIYEDGTLDCLFSCVGVNSERLIEDAETELFYIEEELKKDKVVGIKIYAGYFHYYAYDPIYTPVYELAKKYNIPVAIHCGDTQSPSGLLKYAHPLTIDELAVNYSDINFIICHIGSPWALDAAEVIAKNNNVYTDLSGLLAGNEKEVRRMKSVRLFREHYQKALIFANSYDKVLFGTDWPLVPIQPYVEFVQSLIPKEYYEQVFYKNALEVYSRMKKYID
ncbi:amidohydrolase family protein [Natranaerovirga hydrolytica]|nr:amidohydrolase family protein [Natranaerovirga hydrolytica]